MARHKKIRKIGSMPEYDNFGPLERLEDKKEVVTMLVDEYEVIRLIDMYAYSQKECAERMGVARTTVQSIYEQGRHKLAEALVTGKSLKITGGNYELCPEMDIDLKVKELVK
ncbi:DUF134 domain-containing protein [Anaerolentibacter hominis]|uniref:DUF134 domain-containing protein n=1 Tax=Anaerolentibacter hominis TaxID=3079009 RepID=UPI0031B876D0